MVDIKSTASDYFSQLRSASEQISPDEFKNIVDVLYKAYKNNKTTFIIGNGGSAASASHIAIDLGKGTLANYYNKKEKRLRVISLTDNVAAMTAIANDLSYDDLFVEQLHNLIKPGDVVIGLTGSGNSANVIKALIHARFMGAITVGFLGFHYGGRTNEFADYSIIIQSNHQGIVEDLHLSIGHALTDCLLAMKKEEKVKANKK